MGILSRISSSSMVGRPFTDYLNVSVPVEFEGDVRSSILSVIDILGNSEEVSDGLFSFGEIAVKNGKIVVEHVARSRWVVGARWRRSRLLGVFCGFYGPRICTRSISRRLLLIRIV